MAKENRIWGCGRIQGALSNLDHEAARGTIAEMFARRGMEPATGAGAEHHWKEFLAQPWDLILVRRFFTHQSPDATRTTAICILFFMELWTRKWRLLG